MQAGKLRSKIQILKPSKKRDNSGEFGPPDVFASRRAEVDFLASKYTQKAGQMVTESTHKLTVRWLAGVTSAMKIRMDGQIFNIEGTPIDPDNRRRELHIYCYLRNDGAAGSVPANL